MKTTVFKPTTMPSVPTGKRKPTINFNHKSGLICLSEAIMVKMDNPKKVSFKLVEPDKETKEWYVCADHEGFSLRRDYKSRRGMFNTTALARMIVSATTTLRVSETFNEEHGGYFIFPQEPAEIVGAKKATDK